MVEVYLMLYVLINMHVLFVTQYLSCLLKGNHSMYENVLKILQQGSKNSSKYVI